MSTSEKHRALIAEDDRALADIIRLALMRDGHDVTLAGNGKLALQIAMSAPFDLIVSDYQMPLLNGEQLLTSVRTSGPSQHAILILCSAKCYEIDSERLRRDLDLAGVFYKPFSLAALVSAARDARERLQALRT